MERKIMIVDDDKMLLGAFARNMQNDFSVDTYHKPQDALDAVRNSKKYAVVVSDYRMPDMDGIAFLKQMRQEAPETIRILLTGHADLSVATEAVNEGQIFKFLTKPLEMTGFSRAVNEGLKHYIDRKRSREAENIVNTLNSSYHHIEGFKGKILARITRLENENQLDTTLALTEILKTKLPAAYFHSIRTSNIAWEVGQVLGMNQHQLQGLYIAGLLHDIGKLMVPSVIVTKKQQRSPMERHLYELHCEQGYDMLKNFPFSWMLPKVCLQHHETIDGKGYPEKLKSNKIEKESLIIGMCNQFDHWLVEEVNRTKNDTEWKTRSKQWLHLKKTQYPDDIISALMEVVSEGNVELGCLSNPKDLNKFMGLGE